MQCPLCHHYRCACCKALEEVKMLDTYSILRISSYLFGKVLGLFNQRMKRGEEG